MIKAAQPHPPRNKMERVGEGVSKINKPRGLLRGFNVFVRNLTNFLGHHRYKINVGSFSRIWILNGQVLGSHDGYWVLGYRDIGFKNGFVRMLDTLVFWIWIVEHLYQSFNNTKIQIARYPGKRTIA